MYYGLTSVELTACMGGSRLNRNHYRRTMNILPEAAEDSSTVAEDSANQGAPSRLRTGRMSRFQWWVCGVVALGFAAWSLRSVGPYNIAETDAARHAMNGAFLHDLIAGGKFSDVIGFARNYYAHLPALSIPYHPPLFPLIEALFFAAFGVSPIAAKLPVTLAVAVCAIFMFRLMSTHRSLAIAALSTITFFSLPEALWVSADVMLEFPALAFVLPAVYCLQSSNGEYKMRFALGFAALAAAAVWTKQQTVFLGATPILYLILSGRLRQLLKVLPGFLWRCSVWRSAH